MFGLLLFACGDHAPSVPPGEWANVAPARVEQVLHGEGRAYLGVVEGQYTFWASIPETQVEVGQFVLLGKGPLRYAVRGGGILLAGCVRAQAGKRVGANARFRAGSSLETHAKADRDRPVSGIHQTQV